ncbi:DUF2442 domain-containing protein [Shinella sp. G-2]|uniref:DUF2442 domain-containing protein n=1 Tax=Shinella sp. G-2 TaxID=3133141 RepID=UPI003D041768
MSHPPVRNARYDRRSCMIVVEFNNGSAFVVPARSLRGLEEASESEIAEVELSGQSGLHWERLNLDHDIDLLISGRFATSAFESGEAQTANERVGRTGEPPPIEWVGPAITFLSNNLPGNREFGWEHHFITGYQIACEALVALGQADENNYGAVPRDNPALPGILPRWDDVATAVVFLAAQNGSITFLASDDAGQSQLLGAGDEGSHQSGNGMWAARADPEVTSVFRAIGLLDGFDWTAASETILWRDSPIEWRIDFTKDSRFIDAVNDACERMPDNIRKQIDRLAQTTDEDIAAHSSKVSDRNDGGFKQSVVGIPPKTPEQVRATLHRIRRYDFDELFYQFWRIGDGWLSGHEAKRALEIFNDPLAIAMRKAVAARLYPHLPHLAE